MKVKHSPEDFIVEELTDVEVGDAGEFAFYKLEKTGWTTSDALAAIRRRWHIEPRRLDYGGLKDRHAETMQYFSIYRGPRRNLQHERIAVAYLGQITHPYSSQAIRANRFAITLRSLSNDDVKRMETAVSEVAACGVPNYFDDQRFGSVGGDGAFVAKAMVLGQFEDALKLALAGEYEFDRAEARREKKLLYEHWGDWPALKAKLPRGHARSLVDYLVHHPTDFKGAIARLRPELAGLYLSAYQSFLWNRLLSRWLTTKWPPEMLTQLELKLEAVTAPRRVPSSLAESWKNLALPLPSARLKPDPASEWLPMLNEILAEEGLTLDRMKVPGMQKPFFSKGDRAACLMPANLRIDAAADEKHVGRRKAVLKFDLGRGSYATMVVKRLTADSDS